MSSSRRRSIRLIRSSNLDCIMSTQAIRALVSAFVLCGVLPVCAQLPAPTAISDADYAGCNHHTCVWVPSGSHKIFARADLSYTVEVPDENQDLGFFVLRRGAKELLRTPLKDLSA